MITTFIFYVIFFYFMLTFILKKVVKRVLVLISLLVTLLCLDFLPYLSFFSSMEKLLINIIPKESFGYIILLYGIYIYYVMIIILVFLLIYCFAKKDRWHKLIE
jgi:hypothetical protein